jgi:hypothetical protein
MNNDLSFWGGQPYGKSDFLAIIGPIREKALTQRIIPSKIVVFGRLMVVRLLKILLIS